MNKAKNPEYRTGRVGIAVEQCGLVAMSSCLKSFSAADSIFSVSWIFHTAGFCKSASLLSLEATLSRLCWLACRPYQVILMLQQSNESCRKSLLSFTQNNNLKHKSTNCLSVFLCRTGQLLPCSPLVLCYHAVSDFKERYHTKITEWGHISKIETSAQSKCLAI